MNRLAISFSGGRTSAYMAKRLIDLARDRGDTEVVVTFANTGQEDERTLEFVNRCDQHFGLDTVWLEAVVRQERGQGTTFRVVDFASAARRGEPFEDVITKFGVPNPGYPHCTRELKLRPMQSYLRSIGWAARTYDVAIGIRVDEMDRQNADARKQRIIYPLIKWGVRKADVLSWWQGQSFDLDVPEHRGNCVTCWKKSDRKLFTIAKETPAAFAFFDRMEREYPDTGPGDERDRPRRFFRKNRSTQDILAQAVHPFSAYRPDDELQIEMDMLDLGGGCGESCEVFTDYEAA